MSREAHADRYSRHSRLIRRRVLLLVSVLRRSVLFSQRSDIDAPFQALERIAGRTGGYAIHEREQIPVAPLRKRRGRAADADLHEAMHRLATAARPVDIFEMHAH